LGTVLVVLATVPAAQAETYALTEAVNIGDCFHVRLDMKLTGENRIKGDGKIMPIKLEAMAVHEFPERVLSLGGDGLPNKAARLYETAKVVISVGGDRFERSLRPERRQCVAQRYKDQPLLYSPAGPLTRDEVEVTEHFDSLQVLGLLPIKSVEVGETWKVPSPVVQALCAFEGLTEQDLSCKLEKVKDNIARVSITGSASGIDLGAMVKLKIEGMYRFDLSTNRLVTLDWSQKDDREQGPVNPASVLDTTISLKRTAIQQPEGLSDGTLAGVPADLNPPASMINLSYQEPKGRYELIHGREWYIVAQVNNHLVMRLMERGDFVAQVTITPWTPAEKGKHLTPEQFKGAMAETPGWQMEKELQAGQVPGEQDRWIYRVSALGQMDGVAVLQNFYLVAGPDGQQVVLVFTMTPKQGEKLGSRDLSLAGSIEFPTRK
jgi:hypothetical protein